MPNAEMTTVLYEYETQHFGFSPRGFVDTVHNVIVDKWSETVDKVLMPAIPLDNVPPQKALALKKNLVAIMFRKGIINSLMDKMEDYLVKYVFRIPNFVSLPGDECNLEVNEEVDEEGEIMARIQALEREIIETRLAIKMLDDEIENTEKTIALVEAVKEN